MDGDMTEHHRNKYTMWMNRQQVLVPRGRAAASSGFDQYYESWEERAFAEDAARGLGGFIWPPRSYTCSFCRREFKSAQALGGHMNVHRRDRARLKQALRPRSSETSHLDKQQQHADSSVQLEQTRITFPTSTDQDNPPYHDSEDHHARKKSISVVPETEREDKELHVSTKLCMGMGLRLDKVIAGANYKCKRLKSAGNFFLVDPCPVVQSHTPTLLHHEGDHHDLGGVKVRLMEELDLELRLGVRITF